MSADAVDTAFLEQAKSYSKKEPAVAGLLSVVIPGGGQFYNGQGGKGALMLIGSVGALVAAVAVGPSSADIDPITGQVTTTGSDGVFWGGVAVSAAIDLWSIIDAVTVAGRMNREHGLAVIELPLSNARMTAFAGPMYRDGRVVADAGVRIRL